MNQNDDQESTLTLLDKATEGDGVYVLCPREKLEELAAEVIMSKLRKLAQIRELLVNHKSDDEWDDVECLGKVNAIAFGDHV